MAIKGITDRPPRLVRAGHLRIGEKVPTRNGGERPSKIDYFKFDPEPQFAALAPLFHQIYGDRPTRITIALISDDPDKTFNTSYSCYGKGTGLKCRGDGETATRFTDQGDIEVPCPGPDACEFARKNGCKSLGMLQFFIQGLPTLHIFQINTGSYNSIVNLDSQIKMFSMLRNGGIGGVWIDLVLMEKEGQADGKRVKFWCLSLDTACALNDVRALESAFTPPRQLPGPDTTRDPLIYHPAIMPAVADAAEDAPETDGAEDAVETTAQPVASPAPVDIADDPAVQAALANCPEPKRKALLAAAARGGWSAAFLIATASGKSNGNSHATANGASKPATTRPAAAKPAAAPKPQPEPASAVSTSGWDDGDF
jgi:hypothetical protein